VAQKRPKNQSKCGTFKIFVEESNR